MKWLALTAVVLGAIAAGGVWLLYKQSEQDRFALEQKAFIAGLWYDACQDYTWDELAQAAERRKNVKSADPPTLLEKCAEFRLSNQ